MFNIWEAWDTFDDFQEKGKGSKEGAGFQDKGKGSNEGAGFQEKGKGSKEGKGDQEKGKCSKEGAGSQEKLPMMNTMMQWLPAPVLKLPKMRLTEAVEFVEPKFDVTLTAPLDSSVLAVTAWCV